MHKMNDYTKKDVEKEFFVYETPHTCGGNKRHLVYSECTFISAIVVITTASHYT